MDVSSVVLEKETQKKGERFECESRVGELFEMNKFQPMGVRLSH